MAELKALLLHMADHFPRPLTRTELVKLVYLADCEFYRLYGRSLSGVTFRRDYYGPHCAEIPAELFDLSQEHLISIETCVNIYGGPSYLHSRTSLEAPSHYDLSEEAVMVADAVIGQARGLSLSGIKDLAYQTPPMRKIIRIEERLGGKRYGEAMDMATLRPALPKRNIARLKAALKRVNLESRGSDEEYIRVVEKEAHAMEPYRKKAMESAKA